MGEPYIRTARSDSRSVMAQASDARPFKPYVYGGETTEPAAVTAARKRHRARDAEIERMHAQAAAERAGTFVVGPGTAWFEPDGDELAEIVAARDRYQEAMALTMPPARPPAPAAEDVPAPPAPRCRRCGYLTTSIGHKESPHGR